jgi:hypothetical protein
LKLRILQLVALMAIACGPAPSTIATPFDPGLPIDVQRLAARPRLTMLRREGDPTAVLALAATSQSGAAAHVALATIVERRLADRRARGAGDSIGLRLSLEVAENEDLDALLVDIVAALRAPVVAGEVEIAAERVRELKRQPLDAPALVPLATCSGEAAALAKDAGPPTLSGLEAARAALSVDRMAIAFVGPTAPALPRALAASGGWPLGGGPDRAWPRPTHGAFVTSSLPDGAAAAEVAVRVPDATAAVAAAQRMAEPSPLAHKLALLERPWRLEAITATAHPRGGCLRARIAPAAPIPPEEIPRAAAIAVSRVEAELVAEQARAAPAFHATREIMAAGTARETAERAAWWALHERATEPPIAASALALGASRESPEMDDATSTEAYVRALAPAPRPPELPERLRVEVGQGEIWLLVANPCALLHEEIGDAGLSALAASATAAQSELAAVSIQPWVSPAGVGLIAHGGPRSAEETPEQLAERIGDALGRALTALPRDPDAFDRAQSAISSRLADERSLGLFAVATRIAPRHPSWLSPWGARATLAGFRREDAWLRWQSLLGGAWRAAAIGNTDEAQARRAIAAVRRWLPPTTASCGETAEPEPFRPGALTFSSSAAIATIVVAADARGAASSAEVVAAALSDELLGPALAGLATQFEARVAGRVGVRSLIVVVEAPSGSQGEVKRRLEKLFGQLAVDGLSEASLERARERARVALAHPSERLAALWRDARTEPPVDDATVRAWTKAHLAPGRLAWAHDDGD